MQDLKLAVLIDADNISPKYVKVILDEAASFGVAACKRIYGDWSDARLKSWKDVLLNNSIIPIQQYSYTTGKNATDSAMIIDAMDLLYAGNGWLLHRFVRFGLYPPCRPPARSRQAGHRHGRKQGTWSLCESLRPVQVP